MNFLKGDKLQIKMTGAIHLILFEFTIFLLLSCAGNKHCNNCGSVLYKMRTCNSQTHESVLTKYSKDRKLWFRDSLVIGEVIQVNTNTIHEGAEVRETWEGIVAGYVFMDLRKKSYYEYASFSDTARLIDKYRQPDTGEVKGGWKFFSKNNIINSENLESLPDTVMDGITYRRVKSYIIYTTEKSYVRVNQTGYLRCDKKNSVFRIDNPFSEKMGCPLVREDLIDSTKQQGISFDTEFLPGKLTPAELKVFTAWERNARNNPVK